MQIAPALRRRDLHRKGRDKRLRLDTSKFEGGSQNMTRALNVLRSYSVGRGAGPPKRFPRGRSSAPEPRTQVSHRRGRADVHLSATPTPTGAPAGGAVRTATSGPSKEAGEGRVRVICPELAAPDGPSRLTDSCSATETISVVFWNSVPVSAPHRALQGPPPRLRLLSSFPALSARPNFR